MNKTPRWFGVWASRILTGALVAASWTCAWADAAAEQRERALLWRQFLEAEAGAPRAPVVSLPGASLPAQTGQSFAAARRRMLEETQWRSLLSRQQMQRFAPETQAGAQSSWNGQILDRERKADALSADILQRSRSYLSNAPR